MRRARAAGTVRRGAGAALLLAALVAPGLAAAPPTGAAPVPARRAPTALPAVQLRVEVRAVPLAARVLRPPEPLRPGAVVTGTAGQIDSAGSVTVRTVAAPQSGGDATRQVLVANGAQAVLRWQQAEEVNRLEFIWTAQGQGVTGGSAVQWRSAQWSVTPRWAAEGEPVELALAVAGSEPAAPQVQTVVRVPLGLWQAVARSVGDGAGLEWQVRVSLAGP